MADGAVLVLLPADPSALAVDGGDPPDQLHVTLTYVTDDATTLDDATRQAIVDAVTTAVADYGPITAILGGATVFPDNDGDGTRAVTVCVESEAVVELQATVDEVVGTLVELPDTFASYIPHITLGYADPADPLAGTLFAAALADAGTPVTFDRVAFWAAGETVAEIPLPGDPIAPPAEEAPMPDTTTTVADPATFAAVAVHHTGTSDAAWDAAANEARLPSPLTLDAARAMYAWFDDGRVEQIDGVDSIVKDACSFPHHEVGDNAQPGVANLGACRAGLSAIGGGRGAGPDAPWWGDRDAITSHLQAHLDDANTSSGTATVTIAAEFVTTGDTAAVTGEQQPMEPMPPSAGMTTADDGRWAGPLIVEGVVSGDGRVMAQGALTWRDLPLPLMVMFRNPDGGAGHDAAELAGRIDRIDRQGDTIWGYGVFDLESPVGVEAHRLVRDGFMRGVSVDLDQYEVTYENPFPDDPTLEDLFDFDPGNLIFTAARIMGATMTAFPAFQEAYIYLVDAAGNPIDGTPTEPIVAAAGQVTLRVYTPLVADPTEGALVASAAPASAYPVHPPADWFARHTTDGLVWPLRVTPDGHVFGHVAAWDSCHISYSGRCVAPPRSACGYAEFRKGHVLTAEGDLVATGPLVMDTVHPSLARQASDAQAFYAHTGSAVADVVPYEDEYGIFITGALRPGTTPEQVRTLRASDVSPDWRHANGNPLECVAMLVVNCGGFKVPTSIVASAGDGERLLEPGRLAYSLDAAGEVVAMVAAGGVRRQMGSALIARIRNLEDTVADLSAAMRPIRAERVLPRLRRQRPAPDSV